MPLRNRMTPEGEIVAHPARGTLMGNRGRLHRPDRTLGPALWTTKAWIACALVFRDRRRRIMDPASYTENRSRVTFAEGARTLPDPTIIRAASGPALLLGDTLRAAFMREYLAAVGTHGVQL